MVNVWGGERLGGERLTIFPLNPGQIIVLPLQSVTLCPLSTFVQVSIAYLALSVNSLLLLPNQTLIKFACLLKSPLSPFVFVASYLCSTCLCYNAIQWSLTESQFLSLLFLWQCFSKRRRSKFSFFDLFRLL